jgi:hypothetical protein
MMSLNINCLEFNPENYRDKHLMWFNGEQKGHFRLCASVSADGRTFNLTATPISLKSRASRINENEIAVVPKEIDEDTLRKMAKPKSRFLKPFCDYVIFDNSPQAEAKFGAE